MYDPPYAAGRGKTEIAGLLLDCGADMDARDSAEITPLGRATNYHKTGFASLPASCGEDAGPTP